MRGMVTKLLMVGVVGAALAGPFAAPSVANHSHVEFEQGPSCGDKWRSTDRCSFEYRGGQIYVGASAVGTVTPEAGGATVRLEARSRITGERRVLTSCSTAAQGACSTGGSLDVVENLRKGQTLFCIVEGVGRGGYECGSILRRKA